MEIRTKKQIKKERWVLMVTVIIGLFTINLLASRHFKRLDLTEQNIYTLADSTKNILKNLNDVVTLRLYFTPELPPALGSLRSNVEDVLAEFKTYSGNNVKIEYHNPQETPIEEQKMMMMGIPPIEVTVIEKDKQVLARIFLGMTVLFEGKKEILAIIQNTSNLEYRLAAAITKVTRGATPLVGWWGPSLPEEQKKDPAAAGGSYTMLLERIERRFQVEKITDEKLDQLNPATIPTLLFVVPETLTPEEVTAFSNYLDQGGKAILLVGRVAISMGQGLKPTLRSNPLEALLKSYGVTVRQDLVLDRSNAQATFSGGYVNYRIPYPYWVRIRREGFDRKEPMVSELSSLVLPWSNSLQIIQKPGIESTLLFETTPSGGSVPVNTTTPLGPQEVRQAMAGATPHKIPLGLLLTKENKEGENARLLVIGNIAFLQNSFLQQFDENRIFVENALDVLSTGDALVGIRSKGIVRNPLEFVSDAKRTLFKFIDLTLAPLLLLLLGTWILFRRRSLAKKLQLQFSSNR